MSAVLVDGFNSTGGEGKGNGFLELGDVDALLLQVGVLALGAGRVELGSTGPVGVSASYLRALLCNWAFLCHCSNTLH